MARSHRRIMLKNLKKAHSPAAKRKAAETRRRNRAVDASQTHKKAPGKRSKAREAQDYAHHHAQQLGSLSNCQCHSQENVCPSCGRPRCATCGR